MVYRSSFFLREHFTPFLHWSFTPPPKHPTRSEWSQLSLCSEQVVCGWSSSNMCQITGRPLSLSPGNLTLLYKSEETTSQVTKVTRAAKSQGPPCWPLQTWGPLELWREYCCLTCDSTTGNSKGTEEIYHLKPRLQTQPPGSRAGSQRVGQGASSTDSSCSSLPQLHYSGKLDMRVLCSRETTQFLTVNKAHRRTTKRTFVISPTPAPTPL